MATYSFVYEEVSVNQVFFVADSEDEAKVLFEKAINGQISVEDLPNFAEKNKWYELSFDNSELETIGK